MTASSETEMQDLLDLARDKSVAGRTRLVQIVGDLFFDGTDILSENERALMTDILRQLIHDVEMSVRRELADRLAGELGSPPELVTILANDTIEVAHNILLNSDVLQDLELIEIVQHQTFEHQLAIAAREKVSEAVSDALVETHNPEVIVTLIENDGADISDNTLEVLVNQSKTTESYQQPLLERPELGQHLAKRMYWWVSAALRQHIVANYKIDPTKLDQKIESTIKDLLGEQGLDEEDVSSNVGEIDMRSIQQASQLASRLASRNAITPTLLVQTLRKGEVGMFEGMFAQSTGLRAALVRRLIFEPGGEGLAIACKAIGMNKPDFGSLFLLSRAARPGDKSVDPREVARAMSFFDRLKPEIANKVVARWKLDPNYLFAIKQVEGGSAQKAAAAE
jgi:uncharacterized protein (DUF2336 family)